MPRPELLRLFECLDDETRSQWQDFLEEIDEEVQERGPGASRDHLEAAQRHLLAACWALHLCFEDDDARDVIAPVGDAARLLEDAKAVIAQLHKKPGWSQ
jgi:hypothetical protein